MNSIPNRAVPVTASDTNYITDGVWNVGSLSQIVFTSVDLSAETLTFNSHGLNNGDVIQILDAGTTNLSGSYYVISSTTNTIQIATTFGGSAVNIGGAATTAPTVRVSLRYTTSRVEGCISVVGAGDVVVLPAAHLDTNTATPAVGGAIKYTLAAGQTLPVLVKKVFSTGTTATGIVCNYGQ